MAERIHIAHFGPGTACSAGIAAFPGQAANELAINTLTENKIDPGDHRSSALCHDIMQEAEAVITMTAAQHAALCRAYPEHGEKIRTLHKTRDIEDPFGFTQSTYDACFAQISECIIPRK